MHVNYLALRMETDWDLLKVIAEQDWVLETNNAIEFRGRYRDIDLHPGVIFLLPAVRHAEQLRLFEAALNHVSAGGDMVNREAKLGTMALSTPWGLAEPPPSSTMLD